MLKNRHGYNELMIDISNITIKGSDTSYELSNTTRSIWKLDIDIFKIYKEVYSNCSNNETCK